jgi:hypothetical protein
VREVRDHGVGGDAHVLVLEERSDRAGRDEAAAVVHRVGEDSLEVPHVANGVALDDVLQQDRAQDRIEDREDVLVAHREHVDAWEPTESQEVTESTAAVALVARGAPELRELGER